MTSGGPVFRADCGIHTCNSPGRSAILIDFCVGRDKSRVNMVTVRKKSNVLSLEEKVKVIRKIEYAKKKADVCREVGLVNKIICAFEENGPRKNKI
jgi:hypothetical protein